MEPPWDPATPPLRVPTEEQVSDRSWPTGDHEAQQPERQKHPGARRRRTGKQTCPVPTMERRSAFQKPGNCRTLPGGRASKTSRSVRPGRHSGAGPVRRRTRGPGPVRLFGRKAEQQLPRLRGRELPPRYSVSAEDTSETALTTGSHCEKTRWHRAGPFKMA